MQTQLSTKCSRIKIKIWPRHWKNEVFHSKCYFIGFRRLISNLLWKIVGLFLHSMAEILDFTVSLSTLPALNDFSQYYDFVMIIKRDFNTTKKLSKNYFKLISLIFLRMTKMKEFMKFLQNTRTFPYSVYLKSVYSISFVLIKIHLKTNNWGW